MFERWNWLDRKQFREDFGYTDVTKWKDIDIAKATRYGCMRVDVEYEGSIRGIQDGIRYWQRGD